MSGAITKRVRQNFVTGRLSQDIDETATTLTAVDFALLPEVAAGEYAMLTIDPDETAGPPEVVRIYEHLPGSQTISATRGAEGTTPRAHGVNTEWRLAVTADDFDTIESDVESLVSDLQTDVANTYLPITTFTGHTHSQADITDPSLPWDDITDKPSSFNPSSHNHSAGDINSGTISTSRLPYGNTSGDYGIVRLTNSVTSTSTTYAATAKAVRDAYNKGNHSHPYASTSHTHDYISSTVPQNLANNSFAAHRVRNIWIGSGTPSSSGRKTGDIWFKT